jgi:hypothetical protein
VDDVFRVMRLVGLRNQAAAAVELGGEVSGQRGEGADGQVADEVRNRAAGDDDAGRSTLRDWAQRREPARSAADRNRSAMQLSNIGVTFDSKISNLEFLLSQVRKSQTWGTHFYTTSSCLRPVRDGGSGVCKLLHFYHPLKMP